MARNIGSIALVVMVVMAGLLTDHGATAAVTSCSQVTSALSPCFGYLLGGGSVPAGCCNAVRSLLSSARTTQDRRTACACMKSALTSGVSGAVLSRASGLPGRCGVSSPFNISPSTNCNSVN